MAFGERFRRARARFSFKGAKTKLIKVGARARVSGIRFAKVSGRATIRGYNKAKYGLTDNELQRYRAIEQKQDSGRILTKAEARQLARLGAKKSKHNEKLARSGRVATRFLVGGEVNRQKIKRLLS